MPNFDGGHAARAHQLAERRQIGLDDLLPLRQLRSEALIQLVHLLRGRRVGGFDAVAQGNPAVR